MTLPDPRYRRLALLRRLRAQVAAEINRLDLTLAIERARLEGRPVPLESGRVVPPCGTETAYQWHRHLASKMRGYRHDCDACRAGHARHNRPKAEAIA